MKNILISMCLISFACTSFAADHYDNKENAPPRNITVINSRNILEGNFESELKKRNRVPFEGEINSSKIKKKAINNRNQLNHVLESELKKRNRVPLDTEINPSKMKKNENQDTCIPIEANPRNQLSVDNLLQLNSGSEIDSEVGSEVGSEVDSDIEISLIDTMSKIGELKSSSVHVVVIHNISPVNSFSTSLKNSSENIKPQNEHFKNFGMISINSMDSNEDELINIYEENEATNYRESLLRYKSSPDESSAQRNFRSLRFRSNSESRHDSFDSLADSVFNDNESQNENNEIMDLSSTIGDDLDLGLIRF